MDIETALNKIAAKLVEYVEDAATLNVVTQSVDINKAVDFKDARPVASTLIKIDGDSTTIVPLRSGPNGEEVDNALFNLHGQNVSLAIQYRQNILNALIGALPMSRR
ncbi:MAG: hypothetical protein V9G20_23580 [Candidatus Promineifilaceae bacterium]|nr:hypothetical protein [Chloroflexota bacterium]